MGAFSGKSYWNMLSEVLKIQQNKNIDVLS